MICVSISQNTFQDCIEAIGEAKMAEIRIDLVKLSEPELQKLFKLKIETIATCREGYYSQDERIMLLKLAINSGAKYIDIEIESTDEFKKELISLAKKNNCKVIISYHNYENTPAQKELFSILDSCSDFGADIAKIACQSNSKDDNTKLLNLYKYEKPVVVLGMGEIGKITRILATSMGSPFTFAAPNNGKITAPGQVKYDELMELIQKHKSE